MNPLLVCFVQTLETGEKIVCSDNGAFLYSKCIKRAPEMTNDCGLKRAQRHREGENTYSLEITCGWQGVLCWLSERLDVVM